MSTLPHRGDSNTPTRLGIPRNLTPILTHPPPQPHPPYQVNPMDNDRLNMVIVCGAMASGKSTFCAEWLAQRRSRSTRRWQSVSQDDMVSLSTHSAAVEVVLRLRGENVILDRVCSDVAQRRSLQKLARRCKALCHCIVLRPPLEVCMAQLKQRGDRHSRFPYSPDNARRLRTVYKAFDLPNTDDDFASLTIIESPEDLHSVLSYYPPTDSALHSKSPRVRSRSHQSPIEGESARKRARLEESLCNDTKNLTISEFAMSDD